MKKLPPIPSKVHSMLGPLKVGREKELKDKDGTSTAIRLLLASIFIVTGNLAKWSSIVNSR